MKSMVYVVMMDKNPEGHGDWEFHKVFQKKSLAEQYISEYNKKAEYNALEIIPTEFSDTEFFIENNKNKHYVEKKRETEDKFDRQYKFAQKVAFLINMIYYEKDIEKKKKLVEDSLLICQKSRHNIRNLEEMQDFIYNIKNTLKGFKGGFINTDAEIFYLTKIYPIFEKYGDEDFVYYLDKING